MRAGLSLGDEQPAVAENQARGDFSDRHRKRMPRPVDDSIIYLPIIELPNPQWS
jgi:hypothetical protein